MHTLKTPMYEDTLFGTPCTVYHSICATVNDIFKMKCLGYSALMSSVNGVFASRQTCFMFLFRCDDISVSFTEDGRGSTWCFTNQPG